MPLVVAKEKRTEARWDECCVHGQEARSVFIYLFKWLSSVEVYIGDS